MVVSRCTPARSSPASTIAFQPSSLKLIAVKKKLIVSDPEIMGGTPCFTGTRVPVQTLMDYLEAGDSIDEFLDDFPSVSRAQVVEFLEEARAQLGAAVA